VDIKSQPVFISDAIQHEEKIRRRAHALYEECGRVDGYDVEDWLRAEADVLGDEARPAAA